MSTWAMTHGPVEVAGWWLLVSAWALAFDYLMASLFGLRRHRPWVIALGVLAMLVISNPTGFIIYLVLLFLDHGGRKPPKKRRWKAKLSEWTAKVREWLKPPVPLPNPV